MNGVDWTRVAAAPAQLLLEPNSQYYWLTYVGALASAAVVVAFGLGQRRRPGALIRRLFPRHLVTHPSTFLDLKLALAGVYFLALVALIGIPLTLNATAAIAALLERWFGPGGGHGAPPDALTTVLLGALALLAIELGYWLAHYAMHRVPFLWEFHKVHHSAEKMTPLTELRQHPLELTLFPILISLVGAAVAGPAIWWFGPTAMNGPFLIVGLVLTLFWATLLHLRHSHLPLHAGGWLGRLIQTPGHHQIHHSTDPRHFDRNFGYCLSLFDWLFGTLALPRRGQRLTLGLGEPDPAMQTLRGSLLAPFARATGGAKAIPTIFRRSPSPDLPPSQARH